MEIPPDDRRVGLQPPRFGLAGLLALMGMLSVLFAFVHYVGLYGSTIAIFFLLCITAHIAGNAIGTRLRAIGSSPPTPDESGAGMRIECGAPARYFAPPSELRKYRSLGKPIVAITVAGAIASGMLSGYAMFAYTDGSTPRFVIALGIGASAVLGAIWSFAAGSFIQVLIRAWFQATRSPRKR